MAFEAELADAKSKLEKALAALANDFKHLRTGQATPALIEHVQVEAYGSRMPIVQVASITVPEPAMLLVKPFDKSTIKAIEKALSEAQLGMTPQSDGSVIRLSLPPLSTERRKQLSAQAKEETEKHKVAMRGNRRDAIKDIETKAKAQKVSEDVVKKTTEKITELLKQYEAKAEAALKDKVESIMKF